MRDRNKIEQLSKKMGQLRDYAMGAPTPGGKDPQKIQQEMQAELLKAIDFSAHAKESREQLAQSMREQLEKIVTKGNYGLSKVAKENAFKNIVDNLLGLGPLEKILEDKLVSDILINGPKQIYCERRGKLTLSEVTFDDEEHLMQVITRICAAVGRQVDDLHAMVDARLLDGSRFNAIIRPLSLDGAAVSIRRFGTFEISAEAIVKYGSMPQEWVEVMAAAVRTKCNIIVSGGTGSGKTTLLNVLSSFIPENERIITIEDSAELQLMQEHVIRLETRQANVEGTGEVNAGQLLAHSLRMRANRIILGEIRGKEAIDMLQAMNTGNPGSMATVHANTTNDALNRFETMVSISMQNMSIKTIRNIISRALDVIIQLNRLCDGSRRTLAITEVSGMEGDDIITQDIFYFEQTDIVNGKVCGSWRATGLKPSFSARFQRYGIELDPICFKCDVPDYDAKNPRKNKPPIKSILGWTETIG